MIEFSNEDELNLTPKLPENTINKIGKSPVNISTLSKVIKRKMNNNLLHKSQKLQNDRERLFLDYQRNSINNINNFRTNLPNLMTSLTPIEKNNYKRISVMQKNKSQGNKNTNFSRNFDTSMLNYYNTDNINFFENEQINNTLIKKIIKDKNNKYNENDINLSQILYKKNKNKIAIGNNLYTRNFDNISNKNNLNSSFLTNINSTTKNNNKLKFTLNKKNLMHTIKKPSKINLEKKNLKYKMPLDLINNYNYGKKKILNDIIEEVPGNIRKLNIKQRNNKSLNKEIIDCSNIEIQNNEKEEIKNNNSKAFIENTLIAFNGLVSQAQELGQILIDNKELINPKNKNELNINNNINNINNINDINVNSKLNKLNQEIKNEHKTVEELQKINSDLNNKINLFNENTLQYENKVKELVTVINQIKNNNNNNISNSNSNSDNLSPGNTNNNLLMKDNINNFLLENKPKKRKMKFGFVETIFMKDDKFEMIKKPKLPQYEIFNNDNLIINKTFKEPKLVFVNINKDNNEKENKEKPTIEEYEDAASQIANEIIIESLISMKKEDKNK